MEALRSLDQPHTREAGWGLGRARWSVQGPHCRECFAGAALRYRGPSNTHHGSNTHSPYYTWYYRMYAVHVSKLRADVSLARYCCERTFKAWSVSRQFFFWAASSRILTHRNIRAPLKEKIQPFGCHHQGVPIVQDEENFGKAVARTCEPEKNGRATAASKSLGTRSIPPFPLGRVSVGIRCVVYVVRPLSFPRREKARGWNYGKQGLRSAGSAVTDCCILLFLILSQESTLVG